MNQSASNNYHDLALLLLRIGVGVIFMLAGWGKLTGIEGPQTMFADLGIPVSGLMAWVVAIIEFFGGLMVLTGTYIRIPTPFLAFIMLIAILTVSMPQGFGAMRLDLLLLLTALALLMLGSGKYSVDQMLNKRPSPNR
ncbi:MAG: DoxX family protein [Balneolales bacterium]